MKQGILSHALWNTYVEAATEEAKQREEEVIRELREVDQRVCDEAKRSWWQRLKARVRGFWWSTSMRVRRWWHRTKERVQAFFARKDVKEALDKISPAVFTWAATWLIKRFGVPSSVKETIEALKGFLELLQAMCTPAQAEG